MARLFRSAQVQHCHRLHGVLADEYACAFFLVSLDVFRKVLGGSGGHGAASAAAVGQVLLQVAGVELLGQGYDSPVLKR